MSSYSFQYQKSPRARSDNQAATGAKFKSTHKAFRMRVQRSDFRDEILKKAAEEFPEDTAKYKALTAPVSDTPTDSQTVAEAHSASSSLPAGTHTATASASEQI